MTNLYAALEIGTSRTVLALGEAETGGRLKISCHAEIPSTGVRKSEIVNLDNVTKSIRAVIKEIEKKQSEVGNSVSLGNAFLVVSGQHVVSNAYKGSAGVDGPKVSNADVQEAIASSRRLVLAEHRELLDIVDQGYSVDGTGCVSDPIGRSGQLLELHTLQIHADKNRVEDARSAAAGAHLEIREPLFAATCAADAVLGDFDRRDGALVLDLGGGSTGYTVYLDGHVVETGVIGVGGDHVTNDIATAFQTTQGQAEELKITEASAMLGGEESASARVKIPGSSPLMEARTISRTALDTVVNARLRELVAIIRDRLDGTELLPRIHSGVFLTGGGAAMRGLPALIQRELGIAVRTGLPIFVDGLDGEAHPESFAAIAGALMYAHRNYEEKPLFKSLFGGLFK